MLVRLQNTIGRNDLLDQMILIPEPVADDHLSSNKEQQSVNLVVGYNGSANSQAALDMTLWIAHQTRLVTTLPVNVQIIYVIENHQYSDEHFTSRVNYNPVNYQAVIGAEIDHQEAVAVLDFPPNSSYVDSGNSTQISSYLQAEKVLSQAYCLVAEWQGHSQTHLKFGHVATELKQVLINQSASLLFLGCSSKKHWIVKSLGESPCAVLGIPKNQAWG
jgi:hypothetical protein